jgi:hypothetical protein
MFKKVIFSRQIREKDSSYYSEFVSEGPAGCLTALFSMGANKPKSTFATILPTTTAHISMDSPARPNKKARLMMAISSSINHNSNAVVFEDDGLVRSILSFLPLSFRFTAVVNRRFQKCYQEVHNGETSTSFQHYVHTIDAAEIWLADTFHAIPVVRPCNVSAQFGRLEILQYFKQKGYAWSAKTCVLAAKGGHLLLLQWMRAPKDHWGQCPWDERTCTAAAENGHIHILQWARANACDWNEDTCTQAAEYGHLHILKWARANGCDWSEWTCSVAAGNGHLHVLQWARANGCDWDEDTCSLAAHNGHSMYCSGREPMGAIGTTILACGRPKMDTSISCSGREPMGAIGT